MKPYVMDIELLSDLSVSDGGVYNSSIDTDICYDQLGLPYIPAKRIKGCLRECAGELNDWGIIIPTGRIFGKGGDQAGTVRFSSAYLQDYEKYRSTILENQGTILTHPQNVLREFSYIRTQTAVNHETGTALDQSLRRMRTAHKGLHFEAELMMPEEDFTYVSQCCRVLKHMGAARTRGLGEVSVTIRKAQEKHAAGETAPYPWLEGSTRLEYEITLLEPLLCKHVRGEEKTADYIEGSRILGLIAQGSKEDGGMTFVELMAEGELICSNAYLASEGVRLTPVPACYYSVKNQTGGFVDKTCDGFGDKTEDNRQLSRMKQCYVMEDTEGRLVCRTVGIEERYHHRRPEDKAVGRAIGGKEEDGALYLISAMSAGQRFRGYIEGTPGQIHRVYEYLKGRFKIRLGAGRSAEYGSAEFKITGLGHADQPLSGNLWGRGTSSADGGSCIPEKCTGKNIVVKLEAPLILYGDNAAYTTDREILIQEILCALGLRREDIDLTECYIKTMMTGGYNVTWGMKKPVLEAFDMGTVICFRMKEPAGIPDCAHLWLGERVSEGFGEVTVRRTIPGNGERTILRRKEQTGRDWIDVSGSSFLTRLAGHLFSDYVEAEAIGAADDKREAWCEKDAVNPTIANMLLICGGRESFEAVSAACGERFDKKSGGKEEKWDTSAAILEDCKKGAEGILASFETDCGVKGYRCGEDQIRKMFLQAYLQEIKYILKLEKGRRKR